MENPALPVQPRQKERLEAELWELRKRHRRRGFWNRLALVAGIFFLGAAPLLYPLDETDSWMFVAASTLYGLALVTLPILRPLAPLDSSIRAIESEIDLLESRNDPEEVRAEKLFRLQQIELKKYYDQTLSHSDWIFWFGILCILFGLGLTAVSLALVTRTGPGLAAQVVIAALGAASGLLANFVAVIYLKMHSETIRSLTRFHNRLVTTHHLHFGNLLAAKLKDPDLREKTLSEMALKLIK